MSLENILAFISAPGFSVWRRIIIVLVIFLITLLFSSLLNRVMKKSFQKIHSFRHDGKAMGDKTKFVVFRRLVIVLIYIIGFAFIIFSIPQLKAFSYSILAGAGVIAIILGFAAQKAFANIISGIFLAVSEPIRVGDRVTINNNSGTIEDITLRHTVIRTWDENRVILPNALMNDAEIVNHSIEDEKILQTLDVGISYDSDIEKAKKIMIDETKKHPDFLNIQDNTIKSDYLIGPVKARVIDLADYSVNLRLYFWAIDKPTGFKIACDLRESIKKEFDKKGIEIPFPYRTIVYKKDMKKKKKK